MDNSLSFLIYKVGKVLVCGPDLAVDSKVIDGQISSN
jgi:hypothetical protein